MENEEIIREIRKLRYHISILGQTIDSENYPIESLILGMDWEHSSLNKVHDIFEKYNTLLEEKNSFDRYEFESDFKSELGIHYQTLKSVILAFYKNSQWVEVCEAYVDSFGEYPAVEYHSIQRRERG